MPLKSLGNAVPTEAERQKMFEALEGLRKRFNENGSEFAAPRYNEKDDTVELCWKSGGKYWVSAWIDGLFPSRRMYIWRHPVYRFVRDDAYLNEIRKE